jgi:hypothetical protein
MKLFLNLYSSIQLEKSSQLTLKSAQAKEKLLILHRNLFHILLILQIFHLEISEEISLNILIMILILLLNLGSLNMSSFPNPKDSPHVDVKAFDLLIDQNQITKVFLGK